MQFLVFIFFLIASLISFYYLLGAVVTLFKYGFRNDVIALLVFIFLSLSLLICCICGCVHFNIF